MIEMKTIRLKSQFTRCIYDDLNVAICFLQDDNQAARDGYEVVIGDGEYELRMADKLLATGYFDDVTDEVERKEPIKFRRKKK